MATGHLPVKPGLHKTQKRYTANVFISGNPSDRLKHIPNCIRSTQPSYTAKKKAPLVRGFLA